MQEHTAKKVRLSILLWLLLLAVVSLQIIDYYERHHAYQWEDMVQPHWESVPQPLPMSEQDDVVEGKNIQLGQAADISLATDVVQELAESTSLDLAQEKPVGIKAQVSPRKKSQASDKTKKSDLALTLPDNLYHAKPDMWEEKKPAVAPDFFSQRPESSSGLQFGGRLIVDEEKIQKKQDANEQGYLDAVQGAEINIKIETK